MRRLNKLALAVVLCVAVQASWAAGVRNVILMIGDGMGVNQVTLARLIHGRLAMDDFPHTGLVLTQSADSLVTDSAAGATALATGHKTNNFTVGQDPAGKPFESLAALAKRRGQSTGLVTTARLTDATPAPFAAHVANRKMEPEIANQLAASGVDVLMGGGAKFFPADVTAKFAGYDIVRDSAALAAARGPKILGLFAPGHLPYVVDRTTEPSLTDMTRKALATLSRNPRGFFMMVEGERIDTAGHSSDAASVVNELLEFDATVAVAREFARTHPDTLVVVTADHATGGLAITEKTNVRMGNFAKVRASANAINRRIKAGGEIKAVLAELAAVTDLTPDEITAYQQAEGEYDPVTRIGEIVSRRFGITFIPFEYRTVSPDHLHGHDGGMVPCYAFGPGAARFTGTFDNTQVFERIRALARY